MIKISFVMVSGILLFPTGALAYDTPFVNNCNATSGVCVKGNNVATAGWGVEGISSGTGAVGVYGIDANGGGAGVVGESANIGVEAFATDNGIGLRAIAADGQGVYATSDTGSAVYGLVNNDSGAAGDFHQSGTGDAIYAASSSGKGIEAYGSDALWGWSSSGDGIGVYGHGDTGTYKYGVWGDGSGASSAGVRGSTSCSSGTCYGVYGTVASCTGTFTTCYAMYSNGAIYINGNLAGTGTYSYSSDERLKKDITPLKGSLDTLMKLKGVSFYWKEPAKHGDNAGIQRGFIAQEYEKVFPEWVTTDQDGHKMISTTGLDALEVESIRQLKADNDDLRARLVKLEGQRHPLGTNTMGWAVAGLALATTLIVSRKKENNDKAEK